MSSPCVHALILSVVFSLWESNLDCYREVSCKFSIYLFMPVISAIASFKYSLCSLRNIKASCCSGSCNASRRFCNWSLIQAFTSDAQVKKSWTFSTCLTLPGWQVTSSFRSEPVSLKPHKPCFNCTVELQILPTLSSPRIWTSFCLWKLGVFVWHLTWTSKLWS